MTVGEFLECSEFYRMNQHSDIKHIYLANNLYNFHTEQYFKQKDLGASFSNAHLFAILDVFNAGRITGIREERAKRKKKGQHKADQ